MGWIGRNECTNMDVLWCYSIQCEIRVFHNESGKHVYDNKIELGCAATTTTCFIAERYFTDLNANYPIGIQRKISVFVPLQPPPRTLTIFET